jgi:hypothetical protein
MKPVDMKPLFGGKFSYTNRVTLYLEGLVSTIEHEAESAAMSKLKESEEYKKEVDAAVGRALSSLYVFVQPDDYTSRDKPRGFGLYIIAPTGVQMGDALRDRKVSVEQLLDAAHEQEDEWFDLYLDDMERLLRKYGRLT